MVRRAAGFVKGTHDAGPERVLRELARGEPSCSIRGKRLTLGNLGEAYEAKPVRANVRYLAKVTEGVWRVTRNARLCSYMLASFSTKLGYLVCTGTSFFGFIAPSTSLSSCG